MPCRSAADMLFKAVKSRENPMKRFIAAVVLALAASGASAEDRYEVKDRGGFGSTGRLVEMASRFGWDHYEVDFDFGLEPTQRGITKDSVLKLSITRRDGSSWSTKCKAKKSDRMWANVNRLVNKGVSVLAECRIPPREFARLVKLDEGLVGEPTLVFQAMVKGGEAEAGLQKGLYFLSAAEIEAGELSSFSTREGDPSALSVLFNSAMAPYLNHPAYAMRPRFLP